MYQTKCEKKVLLIKVSGASAFKLHLQPRIFTTIQGTFYNWGILFPKREKYSKEITGSGAPLNNYEQDLKKCWVPKNQWAICL